MKKLGLKEYYSEKSDSKDSFGITKAKHRKPPIGPGKKDKIESDTHSSQIANKPKSRFLLARELRFKNNRRLALSESSSSVAGPTNVAASPNLSLRSFKEN